MVKVQKNDLTRWDSPIVHLYFKFIYFEMYWKLRQRQKRLILILDWSPVEIKGISLAVTVAGYWVSYRDSISGGRSLYSVRRRPPSWQALRLAQLLYQGLFPPEKGGRTLRLITHICGCRLRSPIAVLSAPRVLIAWCLTVLKMETMFLQNVGICMQGYTASQPRRT